MGSVNPESLKWRRSSSVQKMHRRGTSLKDIHYVNRFGGREVQRYGEERTARQRDREGKKNEIRRQNRDREERAARQRDRESHERDVRRQECNREDRAARNGDRKMQKKEARWRTWQGEREKAKNICSIRDREYKHSKSCKKKSIDEDYDNNEHYVFGLMVSLSKRERPEPQFQPWAQWILWGQENTWYSVERKELDQAQQWKSALPWRPQQPWDQGQRSNQEQPWMFLAPRADASNSYSCCIIVKPDSSLHVRSNT